MKEIVSRLIYISIFLVIASILLINAQENNTTEINVTENNSTNLTINLTENNLTEINSTEINSTNMTADTNLTNITINNTELGDILNNLTDLLNSSNDSFTYPLFNNSICYSNRVYEDYNITVNETNVSKEISLNITICYNQTLVYCFNDDNSSVYLYRINGSDDQCNNHGCDAEQIPNPYDATNESVEGNDTILFICWSKKKQDGWGLWASKGMTLFNQNINVFDFSNSTFSANEYNVTNTTVYNVTNNITNDIINNITNNLSYYYNITNNITNNATVDLSDIENRLTSLEDWRLAVTETLNYLVQIINTIEDIIYNRLFVYDFSNSTFVANEYNITNETVYNVTNDITNNITNNITNDISHFYNITNNITTNLSAEQIQEIEDIKVRLDVLEKWALTVNNLLDIINQQINDLWNYIDTYLR
jgi:hypothetical protein